MNRSLSRRAASALCARALAIAPSARKDLARAMSAEIDHVPDTEVLGFALGCLSSAAAWWVLTPEGLTRFSRLTIAAGALILAGFGILVGVRIWALGAPLGAAAPAGIAAFYLIAAALALKGSLRAVAVFAGIGLVLNSAAFMALSRGDGTHHEFFHALVIEEFALLLMLGGFALTTHWLAGRMKKPA